METLLLVAVLGGAWFWLDTISAREHAVQHGRELAERCGLQLLDETVACTRLWLGRNARGHVQLLRTYAFEVSSSGSDRLACHLVLLGRQLSTWHVPPYFQPLH